MQADKSQRKGFTLIELLTAIGILAVLTALMFPAIQFVREASRRSHCAANMRQISLALHSYESSHRRLPMTLNLERPSALLHWQAELLQFLEQSGLKANIDQKLQARVHVYDMPEERTTNLPIFQCTSNPDKGLLIKSNIGFLFAFTDYCGVAGIEARDQSGVFISNYWRPGIKFSEITDGLSNTLFFGERPPNERGHGYGSWLGSQNALAATIGVFETKASLDGDEDFGGCEGMQFGFGNDERGSRCNWTHHWSFHPNGTNFARCDGSVKFFPYSIDPEVLKSLATRAHGETVSLDF
jgi:prepilin-type N-terminal cleavage/methylation domain-containing protein/prepilin-type processing-associated H-X9-DG protein